MSRERMPLRDGEQALAPNYVEPEKRCEALTLFTFHNVESRRGDLKGRKLAVEAYLRCTRPDEHTGEHRHHTLRAWRGEWVDGWIDEPCTCEARTSDLVAADVHFAGCPAGGRDE